MKITATAEFKKVVFIWNEDLSECTYTALNVVDEEIDALMEAKVHEGADLEGWVVNVEL